MQETIHSLQQTSVAKEPSPSPGNIDELHKRFIIGFKTNKNGERQELLDSLRPEQSKFLTEYKKHIRHASDLTPEGLAFFQACAEAMMNNRPVAVKGQAEKMSKKTKTSLLKKKEITTAVMVSIIIVEFNIHLLT